MKKILVVILLMMCLFVTSCKKDDIDQPEPDDNKIVLPDLSGKSRAEIAEIMKDYEVQYTFKFANQIIENDTFLDLFVSYNNGLLKAGDKVEKNTKLQIFTTVLPLTSNYSKKLKMDFDYTGKSYLKDGIGQVELVSISDGDTATFRDPYSDTPNKTFKVRFLGIDTPETHGPATETYTGQDPWGKAASDYTKKRLNNAKTIVLEAEYGIDGKHTTPTEETYGRYLGFVWVDGVLLNLEIVEQAYSNSTLESTNCNKLYKDYFMEAWIEAIKTGRRFHGEIDPGYNYETGYFK